MMSVPGVVAAGEVGDGCLAAMDAEGYPEEQDEKAARRGRAPRGAGPLLTLDLRTVPQTLDLYDHSTGGTGGRHSARNSAPSEGRRLGCRGRQGRGGEEPLSDLTVALSPWPSDRYATRRTREAQARSILATSRAATNEGVTRSFAKAIRSHR